MNTFLQLPAERRRFAFQQVDETMGLQAFSVEKDFWVCWTLRELFTLPGVGEHLTFKGGTSLSKAWQLIERFSEDIDLIIDKEVLGFGGKAAPDNASTKTQRRIRLDALMVVAHDWVQGTLQPAFAGRLRESLGADGWTLEVDPDMIDGQCLRAAEIQIAHRSRAVRQGLRLYSAVLLTRWSPDREGESDGVFLQADPVRLLPAKRQRCTSRIPVRFASDRKLGVKQWPWTTISSCVPTRFTAPRRRFAN